MLLYKTAEKTKRCKQLSHSSHIHKWLELKLVTGDTIKLVRNKRTNSCFFLTVLCVWHLDTIQYCKRLLLVKTSFVKNLDSLRALYVSQIFSCRITSFPQIFPLCSVCPLCPMPPLCSV